MNDHYLRYRHDEQMKIGEANQFKGLEPRNCSSFGCGRLLTITESLPGTKCLYCQGKKDTVFKHYKL